MNIVSLLLFGHTDNAAMLASPPDGMEPQHAAVDDPHAVLAFLRCS
jgi:hypothetical protein